MSKPKVLMLESYGCETVLRHELSGIALPPETSSYCPIGHDYLLDIATRMTSTPISSMRGSC